MAAALPTPADLGLEESYNDCGDCPRGFTVAPDGGTFAWIDGDELVVHVLGGGSEERTALAFVRSVLRRARPPRGHRLVRVVGGGLGRAAAGADADRAPTARRRRSRG